MKNKLTILKVATIGAIMTASLVGCSTTGGQKLSADEQKKFVEQVNTMIAERKAPTEVEKTVDTKVKQLDSEGATSVVNAYIYSLYQADSEMTNKISAITPDLNNLIKAEKLDLSKKVEVNKLEDGMVKGLFQELTKNHLTLRKDGQNFYANVDMEYVINKYGSVIDSDLKDFMTFRAMEDKKSIFDSEKTSFDLDEVANRLVTIEKKDADIQKSKNKDQWISEQKYYYSIVFGVNHSYFLEQVANASGQTTTGEAPKFKAEIVTKYKDMIKNNADTQFAKDLQGFVDTLDKSGNKLDASVTEYVTKLMSAKYPEDNSATSNELTTIDSQSSEKTQTEVQGQSTEATK